ncbi:diacylglycerol/lipid kinase family protein [Pedobacter cryophilus]|uniref:Diacylglycerol kinase family lipid kinase n=1 Tax=Pedobacter cryophilus TaxID=2571271 RepID=A0A4U1C8I9_9SPHI|nr:diacylglycerol kinase family protein [Pedobacter cryophilus]TKC01014.1 diacylglycerol kinase family lipid kinase [Pedobacter cryophilus]
MKKRILFIVNPISGGLNKTFFPSLLDQYLDHYLFNAEIVFSEYNGHAMALAANAVKANFDIIVAVGGDGTINEVASEVESSGKIMAIIPCGSGNGLARTLGIPLNNIKAIQRINLLNTTKIDAGIFNGKKFFNMAGMGFDAHISAIFAGNHKRGFKGYIKTTLKEISTYKPERYIIEIDGEQFERTAFMLSIANSSQYGNNAHVSPTASLKDGLLDYCIIKPFSMYAFPALGFRMFAKSAQYSKYVEIIKGKQVSIIRDKSGPVHLDGEPSMMDKDLLITVKHLALELVI